MIVDENMLKKALVFAIYGHSGQLRKDGFPYIYHPLSVMVHIRRFKDSKNALLLGTCALLHDAVEDCGIPYSLIEKRFGEDVCRIVKELTTDEAKKKKMGKTAYLCESMTNMSSYALAIKLCDRYDNIMDLERVSTGFRIKYINETLKILDHVYTHRKLTETHKKIIWAILNHLALNYPLYVKDKITPTLKGGLKWKLSGCPLRDHPTCPKHVMDLADKGKKEARKKLHGLG